MDDLGGSVFIKEKGKDFYFRCAKKVVVYFFQ